ncbi:MAG: hypothetical protein ABIH72_01735 [archaeon]
MLRQLLQKEKLIYEIDFSLELSEHEASELCNLININEGKFLDSILDDGHPDKPFPENAVELRNEMLSKNPNYIPLREYYKKLALDISESDCCNAGAENIGEIFLEQMIPKKVLEITNSRLKYLRGKFDDGEKDLIEKTKLNGLQRAIKSIYTQVNDFWFFIKNGLVILRPPLEETREEVLRNNHIDISTQMYNQIKAPCAESILGEYLILLDGYYNEVMKKLGANEEISEN